MTELRFHREIYAGTAVDEALKVFAAHGRFAREETPSHWVVRVEAKSAPRERLIAAELGNYALGLTVRGRGVR